jgi:hypothetical protein
LRAYTDITVLLDRSGSMSTIAEAMETGFNKFIEEHRSNPTTRISLIQFDDKNDYDVVYANVAPKYVEKLKIVPRGNTPLLDSLCQTIDNLGKRYAKMPESERPDQVVVLVITDGEENASKIYKRRDVQDRIRKQEGSYNWSFIYMGANQDSFKEAGSIGISLGSTINYKPNWDSIQDLWMAAASNTVSYANESVRGLTKTLNWTDEQRDTISKSNDKT